MEIKEIIEGWINLIFKDEKIEPIAVERLKQCHKCPFRSNKEENIKLTSYCRDCGCILKTKVRCKDCKCPRGKW